MTLQLYDTAARTTRDFQPLRAGQVGIYLCGPTVQATPHVGHARSIVVVDVLTRWLAERGYAVTLVRNVTDVDDKIIHEASHEGVPFWRVAERNLGAFREIARALGVRAPDAEPRATGHIPAMLELIDRLVAAGYAYPAGTGDVYFAVRRFGDYGALSGQSPDDMLAEATEPGGPKRDPLDFALWKAARPHEPSWSSPFGPGRPGWHIECSAMAASYLGPQFDIHAGGVDLLFPHHENERAQSMAAGDPFARYWLHHGLVRDSGEKMSKSVGNGTDVAHLLTRWPPAALRYHLLAPHYRSPLDWSTQALADSAAAYGRIEGFVRRAAQVTAVQAAGDRVRSAPAADRASADRANGGADDPHPRASAAWEGFAEAMDSDLATPRALAEVHDAVARGNAALGRSDLCHVAAWLDVTRRMLSSLGLDPIGQWPAPAPQARLEAALDALVQTALRARAAARERGDFTTADLVRGELAAAGVGIDDTPDGPRWRLVDA